MICLGSGRSGRAEQSWKFEPWKFHLGAQEIRNDAAKVEFCGNHSCRRKGNFGEDGDWQAVRRPAREYETSAAGVERKGANPRND